MEKEETKDVDRTTLLEKRVAAIEYGARVGSMLGTAIDEHGGAIEADAAVGGTREDGLAIDPRLSVRANEIRRNQIRGAAPDFETASETISRTREKTVDQMAEDEKTEAARFGDDTSADGDADAADASSPDAASSDTDATDAAEAKAKELSVDIASVKGTGKDGRVTVSDVEAASKK